MTETPITVIAQVTDPHVGLGPQREASRQNLERAVAVVASLDPQPVAVLLTGDLTDDGLPEEYEAVREMLEPLAMPVHPIPGNHDRRENLREAFASHPGVAAAEEFIDYRVDCGPVRVVNLDTTIAREAGGAIGEERLAWLEEELRDAADATTIVAMHHAPVGVGLAEFDEIGLAASDRHAMRDLFERGPKPDLVVTGHLHRSVTAQIGGVPVFVCPSTHLQVELDFRREEKLRMGGDPPGIGVHLHGADERLVSHVQPF